MSDLSRDDRRPLKRSTSYGTHKQGGAGCLTDMLFSSPSFERMLPLAPRGVLARRPPGRGYLVLA